MRVVLDTSVLVSSMIASSGTIGQVLHLLRKGEFNAVFSEPIIEELIEVLGRPRIREKYHIRSKDIQMLLGLILLRGVSVVATTRIVACRDPRDNKFLEAAIDGKAECIVTGDSDLLALHPFQGVAILSPAEFVDLFNTSSNKV